MNDVWVTIKEIATDIGVSCETYRTWKHRGYVPAGRHHEIVEHSKDTKRQLTYEQLNALRNNP